MIALKTDRSRQQMIDHLIRRGYLDRELAPLTTRRIRQIARARGFSGVKIALDEQPAR